MTIVLLLVGTVLFGLLLGRWWDEEQRQKQWLAEARKRLEADEALFADQLCGRDGDRPSA